MTVNLSRTKLILTLTLFCYGNGAYFVDFHFFVDPKKMLQCKVHISVQSAILASMLTRRSCVLVLDT